MSEVLKEKLAVLKAEDLYDIVEVVGEKFRRTNDDNACRILAYLIANGDLELYLRWYAYVNLLDIRNFPVKSFPLPESFSIVDVDFDLVANCLARGSNEAAVAMLPK